ncbi:aromatic amino acid aminotransferase [Moniliophthora roreri MCA 2997]|uniref:Aromatic amino acid aminotransferase n=1 Tax=Moniliophthora roreri (strain MCA 2997) TaxID=1381753 RepID=V2XEI2_MONRO|nr:aromatic amino acid aminotransferase [Moniliophthora roreri MCA 2997]
MSSEKSVDAIDLSHHLSAIARARVTSPLKGLAKYLGKPGVISLAGGLPNEAYFPLSSVSGEVLVPDSFPLEAAQEPSSLSWFWNLFTKSKAKERTTRFTVSRFSDNPDDLTLATSLQYGMAKGLPQLNAIIKELTEKVYKPAYSNFTTLVHTGNTDGISKAAWTLCNPGEGVLVSEWTYPSAMATMMPLGCKMVPVKMDSQGMRSDHLRALLSGWDEAERGMPRPHVLYTIPVGQNPTGVTVEYQRKKEIYDICVEFDVIIVEDDPYYFLQSGPYAPQEERRDQPDISTLTDEEYIAQLVPSYLKLDYQGRVIRLDTFSKTIAPGSRLGWFTCNPMFAERIERASETSTQAPCGFGQVFVTSTLLQWKYEGYIRWLKALRIQYKQRRDYFIDCLGRDFHLQRTFARDGFREGAVVYEGFLKSQNTFISEKSIVSSQRVFSFIPPTSGMFIWLQLHLEHHPLHGKIDTTALELKLWTSLAEAGLIIGPGDIFSAHPGQNGNSKHGHFRISFSNSEFDVMKKAVRIFSTILQQFMADTTISM